MRILMLALALAAGSLARADEAEDKAREADMFGGGEKSTHESVSPANGGDKAKSDDAAREDDMFGGGTKSPGSPNQEAAQPKGDAAEKDADAEALMRVDSKAMDEFMAETEEKLALGARLFTTAQFNALQRGAWKDFALSTPSLFDVYIDGRPNDRLRVYARGRLTYNTSVLEGATNPITGAAASQLSTSLDQLWLKWDAEKKVYFTLGRQRIKWGAGRFWNPTDFMNPQRLDPTALLDTRLGTTLFKIHVPIESKNWNFYAVANLSNAATVGDVGGALRAEILVGEAEVTFTGALRRAGKAQQLVIPSAITASIPPGVQKAFSDNLAASMPTPGDTDLLVQLGADVSAAVGPVDLHVEFAAQRGVKTFHVTGPVTQQMILQLASHDVPLPIEYRDEQWIPQVVAGGEWSLRYSEEDSAGLGLEYFYNGAGYAGTQLYPTLASQGLLTPLYVGQHYAAAYVALLNPGSWNNTSITTSVLGNLSDNSYFARVQHSLTVLTNMSWSNYVNYHFGSTGEFRFGGNFLGREIVPPLFEAGTSFILTF